MYETISSSEYRLFCRIRDNGPGFLPLEGEEQQIMHARLKSGLVRPDSNGNLYLPDKTIVLMSRYEDQLEKEREKQTRQEAAAKASEEAADKRWRKDASRSWIQFWLGILFSAIGFAAGVFVEYYFAVLEIVFASVG